MRRTTYILFALVILAAAYVMRMRQARARMDLEAAKVRIRLVAPQPAAGPVPARVRASAAPRAPDREMAPQAAQADSVPQPQPPADAPVAGNEQSARLVKGSSTQVDGTIVYSADAQLDIGNGTTVSSSSGVMVSDEDMRHISGDLVIETAAATTTAENAFLTLDKGHVELTSDTATTEKKDGPK